MGTYHTIECGSVNPIHVLLSSEKNVKDLNLVSREAVNEFLLRQPDFKKVCVCMKDNTWVTAFGYTVNCLNTSRVSCL